MPTSSSASNLLTSPTSSLATKSARQTAPTSLLITPGEPAGIGPDLIVQLAQEHWQPNWVVVADPDLLHSRAQHLRLKLQLQTIQPAALNAPTPSPHKPANTHNTAPVVKVLPVSLQAPVIPGQLNPANAAYVLQTLTTATDLCLQHQAKALVTGPVHKGIINQAGFTFTGHTEFLQQRCGSAQVVMLLAIPELKVALVTTHLPLQEVAAAITPQRLSSVIRILHQELRGRFGYAQPRILVCGLNPHAGEGGHLGREEIDIIQPVLEQLRQEKIQLLGPLPADTLFTPAVLQQGDAVLAMYHDQGLPVLKHLGFGRAANITLGLPIIRTSVDHGTALDLAGSGTATTGSLQTALHYAASFQLSNLN